MQDHQSLDRAGEQLPDRLEFQPMGDLAPRLRDHSDRSGRSGHADVAHQLPDDLDRRSSDHRGPEW